MTWGDVRIETESVVAPGVSSNDRTALLEMVERHHRAWLAQDAAALVDLIAIDAVRVQTRSGLNQGADAIVAALAMEWEPYERPEGIVAQTFLVNNVQLDVRGDYATASYWIEAHGGARWEFDERQLGLDIYRRTQSSWELLFHANTEARRYARADQADLLEMEFVYPAQDIARALAFYEPLLGKPERESATRISYSLGRTRFHLDSARLGGSVEPVEGYPNGYAEFIVGDLEGLMMRLRSAGVSVRAVEDTVGRPMALVHDPDGNVLLVRQRAVVEDSTVPPALTLASDAPGEIPQAMVERQWRAFLTMDSDGFVDDMSPRSRWAFATDRSPTVAYEGIDEIREGLTSVWSEFDRGIAGLPVQADIGAPVVQLLDGIITVCYEYRLSGLGALGFEQRGVAAHLLERRDRDWSIKASFISTLPNIERPILSLDYTGYPVTRLPRDRVGRTERFYTNTLRLGSPYPDWGYRGWWTPGSVFGVYRARGLSPELLRPNRSNGYVSFWVRSAREMYKYLQARESAFPLLPAINDRRGIDRQPGYIQIVSTDSEGNLVLFTEYPGT